ncbi:MAG: MaoC/PaaZ C-terminal domain-containing protein [Polyangiales bacterium]
MKTCRSARAETSKATYKLEEDEIIEYCKKWDPLPMHIDRAAAAKTEVGKLFTSALHTLAIAIKLSYTMRDEPTAVVIGLGWDEVKFHSPACVGDSLRLRGEIIEKRRAKVDRTAASSEARCKSSINATSWSPASRRLHSFAVGRAKLNV